MVKLVPNEFIQEIRGTLEKNKSTFRVWKGRQVLEKKPIPSYTRTEKQDMQRRKFKEAIKKWHALTQQEKEQWRRIGDKQHLTGYQAFLSYWIPRITFFQYKVIVDNTQNSNTLSNYQVLLQVNNDRTFFETFLSDHKYLEVYDSDQSTLLSFWVELWDTANYRAKIWIKVPTIPASSKKELYLKCNTERTQSLSNGDNVFEFFDDFIGTSINTAKWTITDATGWSVANGELKGTSTTGRLTSIPTFSAGIILEIKSRYVSLPANGYQVGGFFVSTTNAFGYLNHPTNDYYRNDANWVQLGPTAPANTNLLTRITVKSSTAVDLLVINYNTGATYQSASNITNVVSAEPIVLGRRYDNQYTGQAYEAYWDWIRVRKYTSPEPAITYAKL